MINIRVACDCYDIPHDESEHKMQLAEGSTVSDVLQALVEKGVGGLTYQKMVEEHVFLRNYLMISPKTEVFDGDRILIILTLDGG